MKLHNWYFIFCTVASYSKSSLKRDYGRREELHPSRSRVLVDYASRVVPERNPPYRDEYASRAPGFSDPPRRDAPRRAYLDDGYGRRFERPPPPSYRDVRARDYDAIIGSKRPYSSLVRFMIIISSYFSLYVNEQLLFAVDIFLPNFRVMCLQLMLMLVFVNQEVV